MTEERLQEIEARLRAATTEPWLAWGTAIISPRGLLGVFLRAEDAAFAAHARTDLVEVLWELRRLKSGVSAGNRSALAREEQDLDNLQFELPEELT